MPRWCMRMSSKKVDYIARPASVARSELMARVRQRDTKPEILLRKALWALGVRYRVCPPLAGRPDVALTKQRVAIFVDGCFWHGCPAHYSRPRQNAAFWSEKLAANAARDAAVDASLTEQGWRVAHIWEHQLKDPAECMRVALDVLGRGDRKFPVLPALRVWWTCECGSRDVQVERVEGLGSLNIRAKQRPQEAVVRCRECGAYSLKSVR